MLKILNTETLTTHDSLDCVWLTADPNSKRPLTLEPYRVVLATDLPVGSRRCPYC